MLKQAIASRSGIYQFVSRKAHLYGNDSKESTIVKMLNDKKRTNVADAKIGNYTMIDFDRIAGNHETDDYVRYELTVEDAHAPDKVIKIPLTQVGLKFTNSLLQCDQIIRASELMDKHLESLEPVDPTSPVHDPLTLSHVGHGRNATLATYRDICQRIAEGTINENDGTLEDALKEVITAGREVRSNFVQSYKQLEELRHALVKKIREQQPTTIIDRPAPQSGSQHRPNGTVDQASSRSSYVSARTNETSRFQSNSLAMERRASGASIHTAANAVNHVPDPQPPLVSNVNPIQAVAPLSSQAKEVLDFFTERDKKIGQPVGTYPTNARAFNEVIHYENGVTDLGRTITRNQFTLESDHAYIQRLFPTDSRSRFNPLAPVLNSDQILALRQYPDVISGLNEGFNKMLGFYGLVWNEGSKTVTAMNPMPSNCQLEWAEDQSDHNNLRITRIIRSMTLFGEAEKATALANFVMSAIPPNEINPLKESKRVCEWKKALNSPPANDCTRLAPAPSSIQAQGPRHEAPVAQTNPINIAPPHPPLPRDFSTLNNHGKARAMHVAGLLPITWNQMLNDSPPPIPKDVDVRDRFEGMMLGLAIGDSLGRNMESVIPEVRRRKLQEKGYPAPYQLGANNMPGFVEINLHKVEDGRYPPLPFDPKRKPGKSFPSDDTQMAAWTLETLVNNGDDPFDPKKLADSFAKDGKHGGEIFGIGLAVSTFRANYKIKKSNPDRWTESGAKSSQDEGGGAGNGALMRIAPIIVSHLSKPTNLLWGDALLAANLTHTDALSNSVCIAFVDLLWHLMSMTNEDRASYIAERKNSPNELSSMCTHFLHTFKKLEPQINTEYGMSFSKGRKGQSSPIQLDSKGNPVDRVDPKGRLISSVLEDHLRNAISNEWSVEDAGKASHSGAYVFETIACVLHILHKYSDDPQKALIEAVNNTRDNDTVGAIVGAAMGALYGTSPSFLKSHWTENFTGVTRPEYINHKGECVRDDVNQVQTLIARCKDKFIDRPAN